MELISYGLGIKWISKLYKKLKRIQNKRKKELNELNDIIIGSPLDLAKYYVEPNCLYINPMDHSEEVFDRCKPIFGEILTFIKKKDFGNQQGSNQMFILSETGVGKSSLLVMLKLLQITSLLPKKPTFILKVLGRDKLDKIEDVEDKGDTVLLLDSLEEDPKAYGREKARILEILKVTQHFLKVIITCRIQFFPEVEEAPFECEGDILLGGYLCQVRYLIPFDKRKVEQYLKKRFPWKKYFIKQKKKIKCAKMIIHQMGNLQFRPMLLAYIEKLMKSPLSRAKNSEYRIYQALLESWLSWEEAKNNVFKKELFKVCEILAIRLSMVGARDMSEKELEQLIKGISDLKYITANDIKGRSLLIRNSKNHYRFAHHSIQEFLVAKHFIDNPHEKVINIIPMTSFIAQLLIANSKFKECWKFFEFDYTIFKDINLRGTVLRAVDFKIINFQKGVNLRGVDFRGTVLFESNFEAADLQVANFQGVELKNSNFFKANLMGANLQYANLEMAILKKADLSWVDLKGANLKCSILNKIEAQGANLCEVKFNKADIRDAVLKECKIQNSIFDGANISGANFQGADLRETKFRQVKGEGTNLSFTDLQNANLNKSCFQRANFEGSYIIEADLEGANLQEGIFHGAIFQNTDLSNANLKKANLRECIFECTKFKGADFTEANFQGANFRGIDFKGAIFQKADFSGTSFQQTDLQESKLMEATFEESNLTDINLQGADLQESQFQNAILDGANLCNANLQNSVLRNASLKEANMKGVKLSNVDFQGADLTGVRNITPKMLLKVKSLYRVKGLETNVIVEILKNKPSLIEEPN